MKFKLFGAILLSIVIISIFAMSIRGQMGNPSSPILNDPSWKEDGPFELSPERGRFALLYSLVEDKSVFFTPSVARFALPDLGYKNGNYVSMFAPAVSFLAAPGYMIGKYFGASQVGSFAIIALFAFLNFWLIKGISERLGSSKSAATLAGLVFIFATPAFSYGVTLYQHHISTFLILMSLYILLRWENILALFTVMFLCASSIPVDYPNLFLMAPIGIFAAGKVIMVFFENSKIKISFNPRYFIALLGFVLPLIFFFWFNKISYDNPLQFSGTVSSIKAIGADGKPAIDNTVNLEDVEKFTNPDSQKRSVFNFFKTRALLNGLYIQVTSPDRGVLYFTPVIIFALFGFGASKLAKEKKNYLPVLLAIFGADILLYSMWGDPWGGWAFGSRYLIPGYAIACILLSFLLTKFRENIIVILLFLILFIYSVCVNTLGALTSNANPPQVQVLSLEKQTGVVQKYTYARNWDSLAQGNSKSFVYKSFLSPYISATNFYFFVSGLIILLGLTQIINLRLNND